MREFALIDGLEPLSLKSLIVTAAGFFFFVALLWIGSMLLPGRIEKGAVLPRILGDFPGLGHYQDQTRKLGNVEKIL